MKLCLVCGKPNPTRSKLCPRCQGMRNSRHDRILRIEDLIAAYDKTADCFRCVFSGLFLDENDPTSPRYRSVDHYIPGEERVVLCCFLFNVMKSSLTGPEFFKVVPHLDDVLRGLVPFDRNMIQFATWNRKIPRRLAAFLPKISSSSPKPVKIRHIQPQRIVNVQACRICGKPPMRHSYYCARCRPLIEEHDMGPFREKAMRDSYDPAVDGFRCFYTGEVLDLSGRYGPWHFSIDHRTPGDKSTQVVAALWVNRLKTFLTEAQFRAVIHALAEHFRDGGPFDPSALDGIHVNPMRDDEMIAGKWRNGVNRLTG